MITVTNQRIRLPLDLTKWDETPVDQITSASPVLANASDLQFELALTYGELVDDNEWIDLTKLSTLTVSLKQSNNVDGLAIWSATVGSAAFTATTYAGWTGGTGQNVIINVSGAQNTLFLPTGSTTNSFQLVISALTAANTTATTTATFTTGATVIVVGSASGILIGQVVAGSGIPTGTVVQNIAGTSITISAATTGNSSSNYTFTTPARLLPVASFPIAVDDVGFGSDVPSTFNASQYYTQTQSDARYLQAADLSAKANLSGATFTGAVILVSTQMSGATGLYATTKAYVDAGDAATAAAAVPVAGVTAITGAKTFSALLTATAGLTTNALTLGTFTGLLTANDGVVSAGGTSDNVLEGQTNFYFTAARTINSVLTGFALTTGTVSAYDSILTAIGKLANSVANGFAGAVVWPVANQAGMLALASAKQGDFAFRADTSTVYILGSASYAILGSWTLWNYPVSSVNSKTGAVVLSTDDVGEGSNNLYFTNARAATIAALLTQGTTFTGVLGFSGTTNNGLVVNNLTTTQITSLAATNGTLVYNTTTSQFMGCVGGSFITIGSSINSLLTGFSATGAMPVTATDSILIALQKHELVLEGKATLAFQGSSNIGLITNQLTTTQINALSVTSASYGAVVYDTTLNILKGYSSAGWVQLSQGAAYLPLTAGSSNKLSAALYFNDGLSQNVFFGTNWGCRTSSSNANFDILNSSTVALTCDSSNVIHAPNGWFDTPNGYKLNGNNIAYLTSSRAVIDFGGTWNMTTTSAYAGFTLGYGGTVVFTADQSGNLGLTQTVTIGTLAVGGASTFTGAALCSDYFNTPNGYKLNGNTVISLSGSSAQLNFDSNFRSVISGGKLSTGYGGDALLIDTSNNVIIASTLYMGSNKVIDGSNFFYDNGGNKILSAQQSAPSVPTLTGVYGTDYSAIQTYLSAIDSWARAHGLIA